MEKETAMKILKELHDNSIFSNRTALETIIPELAYDNDDRIRKDIIAYIKKANGEPYNVLPSGSYCVLEMITWLKKQGKQEPFDYESANIQQKGFAPKQEWSEEDDYNLQCMIAKVTSDIQKGNVGRNNELIDWLKSLKDRVQPKPKEWSEEDERAIAIIKIALEHPYDMEGKWDRKFALDWLKSIKDRM